MTKKNRRVKRNSGNRILPFFRDLLFGRAQEPADPTPAQEESIPISKDYQGAAKVLGVGAERVTFSAFIRGVLRQTGRNLVNTWVTQTMTISAVTLSVLIFAFFLLIHLNMLKAGSHLGENFRFTVYLNEEIGPELQPRIVARIQQFGEIASIRFVSREQAFARFAARLGEERDILDDLGPDFLPPAIEVIPKPGLLGMGDLEQLATYLATLPDAVKVQYGREWLQRFDSFNRLLRALALISAVLLILNIIFIISHTTRLAMTIRRQELKTLSLLGADRSYIRVPFMVEGFLQGALGASGGLGALLLLFQWTIKQSGDLAIFATFTPDFLSASLILLIIGASAALCTLSSLAAVTKSLES